MKRISEILQSLKYKAASIKSLIEKDIWKMRLSDTSGGKSFFYRTLRILIVTFTGIQKNNIKLWAAGLTYYTLLSIVPIIAMAFGIAKGFGMKSVLEDNLQDIFEGQQEVLQYVMDYAEKLLANTQGGIIAGIGLIILFWSVIRLLIYIEEAFNNIWHIKTDRSYLRKFTDYVSMMLIAPILLISANSATVLIITTMRDMAESTVLLSWIQPVIFFMVKLIPYVIFWLLFTLIYVIMPNTRVDFKSALIAGILAGTLYQLTQTVYIEFQVGVSRYSAIYGGLAALPLFLMWVLISWWIILIGAKLAYAHQHIEEYEFGWNVVKPSNTFNKYLALLIVHILAKNFEAGKPPMTIREISAGLRTPWLFVEDMITSLTKLRIITETYSNDGEESAYQPGQDIHNLTAAYVLESMERAGDEEIAIVDTTYTEDLKKSLYAIKTSVIESQGNVLLKDLGR